MRKNRNNSSGAILIEVLITVGLLGLVSACLLSTFQNARRVESQVLRNLEELRASERLSELLTGDLLQARAIKAGTPGVLMIMLRPGSGADGLVGIPMLEYAWDPAESALVRTVHLSGEPPFSQSLRYGSLAEFDLLSPQEISELSRQENISQAPTEENTTWDNSSGSWAKAVRLRCYQNPQVDGKSSSELLIELPIRIPILIDSEVRL